MFSAPDMVVIGVLALLLFGPERLPGMMRQAGRVMRDVQNASQSFVAEMERAAELREPVSPPSPPIDQSLSTPLQPDEPPESPGAALHPPES
ncbi:MAG: twin-arginine translocase TatA/TatE family subunit [Vulcanimicrobiaceae bacterium]